MTRGITIMEKQHGGCPSVDKDNIMGYMQLAAAIYKSGRKEHDKRFLDSAWAYKIKETVSEYAYSHISDTVKFNKLSIIEE